MNHDMDYEMNEWQEQPEWPCKCKREKRCAWECECKRREPCRKPWPKCWDMEDPCDKDCEPEYRMPAKRCDCPCGVKYKISGVICLQKHRG